MATEEKKDLCKRCKHYWLDFPLPLDHYESHCDIVDEMRNVKCMDDVVPYPCTKCPFDAYDEDKEKTP